ncbi:MAG: tripartite tricarboxylate transporter permease, partial [Burkholderiaceae bacterium]
GKGELEGVAAAEAGNNGVAGATLIPLLALGIPGDVITAIIIGAFMIHGLTPGPIMFFQNTDIIYTLFAGLLLSSIFLLFIGAGAIKIFKYIARVPKTILMPSVLVLCVYGGYAVNNSVFDVAVMFLMGGLGFAMYRFNVPPAPFVIAFILGPLFEDNFRQAMLMSGGEMSILLRSPITWFFWIATILTLLALTGAWGRIASLLRKA